MRHQSGRSGRPVIPTSIFNKRRETVKKGGIHEEKDVKDKVNGSSRKLRRKEGLRDFRRDSDESSSSSSSSSSSGSRSDEGGAKVLESQETKRPSPLRIFNTHAVASIDTTIVSVNSSPHNQHATSDESLQGDDGFSWEIEDEDDCIEADKDAVTLGIPLSLRPDFYQKMTSASLPENGRHAVSWGEDYDCILRSPLAIEPNEHDALVALDHLITWTRGVDGEEDGGEAVVGGFDAQPGDVTNGVVVTTESVENGIADVLTKDRMTDR